MARKTLSSSVSLVHDDAASAGTDGFISTEWRTILRPLIPPCALMFVDDGVVGVGKVAVVDGHAQGLQGGEIDVGEADD